MRCLLLGLCLLAVPACGGTSPGAPTVALDERFTLAPGESARVGDSRLRVLFVQVSSDSRCPADAVCIVAGDATVQVQVGEGGATMPYELHTDDPSRAAVVHEGLRLMLVELQPYPFSSLPTLPADYRATFTVTEQ